MVFFLSLSRGGLAKYCEGSEGLLSLYLKVSFKQFVQTILKGHRAEASRKDKGKELGEKTVTHNPPPFVPSSLLPLSLLIPSTVDILIRSPLRVWFCEPSKAQTRESVGYVCVK